MSYHVQGSNIVTVQKYFVTDRCTLVAYSEPFKLVMIDCELFNFMIL